MRQRSIQMVIKSRIWKGRESPEAGLMSGSNKNSIRNITAREGCQMMSLATRAIGPSVIATIARPCVMTALKPIQWSWLKTGTIRLEANFARVRCV